MHLSLSKSVSGETSTPDSPTTGRVYKKGERKLSKQRGQTRVIEDKKLRRIQSDVTAQNAKGVAHDSDGRVFGVPLASLLEKNKTKNPYVPDFVANVFCYLRDVEAFNEEGIFRVSGHSGILEEMRWALDKGINLDFIKYKGCDAHVVAGAFKLWLSTLPDPLLTFERYSKFMELYDNQSDDYIEQLKQLISELPTVNKMTFQLLISYLCQVTEAVEANKMNSKNLALVLAPPLLRTQNADSIRMFTDMPKAVDIVQTIIDSYSTIFPVELPDDILQNELKPHKWSDIMSNALDEKKRPVNQNARRSLAPDSVSSERPGTIHGSLRKSGGILKSLGEMLFTPKTAEDPIVTVTKNPVYGNKDTESRAGRMSLMLSKEGAERIAESFMEMEKAYSKEERREARMKSRSTGFFASFS